MIKKILDWILGKNSTASTMHPLDGATRTAQERADAPYKVEAPDVQPVQEIVTGIPDGAPLVETAPVTVKAKYKKAELNKMTKKELLDLAAQHGVAVKARSTKDELVKVLAKI